MGRGRRNGPSRPAQAGAGTSAAAAAGTSPVATSDLSDRERRILSSLVRRYEQQGGHHDLSQCRLDWLAADSDTDRDQIAGFCEQLIERGLAETAGLLIRAIMPQAALELRAPSERRRLSGVAV